MVLHKRSDGTSSFLAAPKGTSYKGLPNSVCLIIDKFKKKKHWSEQECFLWAEKLRDYIVPREWQDFLPLDLVAERAITGEFSAYTLSRIIKELDITANAIDGTTMTRWLSEVGKDGWDFRAIIQFRREIIAKGRNYSDAWVHGDCRDHMHLLPDKSVSLVLTDPPYGIGYQSNRKVKSVKNLKIKNDGDEDGALTLLLEILGLMWSKLETDAHVLCFCHWSNEHKVRDVLTSVGFTVRGSLIWIKNNVSMGDLYHTFGSQHERIIHATKGSPVLFRRDADVMQAKKVPSTNHPTEKPVDLLIRLIKLTTAKHELIVDPFGGVASTPVAARNSNRRFWSCDMEEEYYNIGIDRIENDKVGAMPSFREKISV